jgi:transposase
MKTILKQVVGIDVAQNELVVSLGRMRQDLSLEIYAGKAFANTLKGFKGLSEWVVKMTGARAPLRFVMEATGVYHESFAYYLDDNGFEISIVLPNKISNYFRTLQIKTITDKTASEAITRFGLERNLDRWERPKSTFKKLRQLTRERNQVIEERTVLKNQLHAEKSEAEPNKKSIERMLVRVQLLNSQEKEIRAEIAEIIRKDKETQSIVNRVCTIPGVGIITAATVLGETNCFELIRNKRQLTSYAGLDVREKLSGTSVKGKPKISKRGNKYLRKAMHMPALSVIKSNEHFKGVFARLVFRHGIKMKAAVAVQRKLLELIYIIYKNNTVFDKDYLDKGLSSITNSSKLESGH